MVTKAYYTERPDSIKYMSLPSADTADLWMRKNIAEVTDPETGAKSYEADEAKRDVLGDDFDARLLAAIAERKPVKARVISMGQRFKPLLKAAASVAILLTLGNAMQVPFSRSSSDPISNYDGYYKPELDNGTNVAIGDSSMTDTLQQSLVTPSAPAAMPVLK